MCVIDIDISPTACRVMAKRLRDVCALPEGECSGAPDTLNFIVAADVSRLKLPPRRTIERIDIRCYVTRQDFPAGYIRGHGQAQLSRPGTMHGKLSFFDHSTLSLPPHPAQKQPKINEKQGILTNEIAKSESEFAMSEADFAI